MPTFLLFYTLVRSSGLLRAVRRCFTSHERGFFSSLNSPVDSPRPWWITMAWVNESLYGYITLSYWVILKTGAHRLDVVEYTDIEGCQHTSVAADFAIWRHASSLAFPRADVTLEFTFVSMPTGSTVTVSAITLAMSSKKSKQIYMQHVNANIF